jgi:hypothetical protein
MTYLIKIIETNEIWDFNSKDDMINFSNNLGESHRLFEVDSSDDCSELKTIWI